MDSAEETLLVFQRCAALDDRLMQEVYFNATRLQRQWSAMAGEELGIAVSTEGGDYYRRVSELLDGFALLEHDYDEVFYWNDMATLWARSGSAWHPNSEVSMARNARVLSRAGVAVGNSGEPVFARPYFTPDGKVLLFELTAAALRVLAADPETTPLEGLRYITLDGARALGLERDLGSIEPGKIADLVVLDGDPLADPHALTDVRYVVQDGFVYEAPSLKPLE